MIPQIQPSGERPSVSSKNFEIPNEQIQGAKTVGSSASLSHALDVVHPVNDKLKDNVGSSASLAKSASKIVPPNHRFEIAGERCLNPRVPWAGSPAPCLSVAMATRWPT